MWNSKLSSLELGMISSSVCLLLPVHLLTTATVLGDIGQTEIGLLQKRTARTQCGKLLWAWKLHALSTRENCHFLSFSFSNRGGWTFSPLRLLTYPPPPPPPPLPLLPGWCSSLAGSTLERPLPPSYARVRNSSCPTQTRFELSGLLHCYPQD